MLKFLYLVNRQGRPRIVQYYSSFSKTEKTSLEVELVKKCLSRSEKQCSFFEWKSHRIVYRKYATLYFIIGIDEEENELAILEFIHNIVETFDKYFEKVCELDIMFNLDRVHMLLNEMVADGRIIETNKTQILSPILIMDQAMKR